MGNNSEKVNALKARGIDPLNVLRVLAALMVFMLHANLFEGDIYSSFYSKGGLRFLFYTPAWAGVWIFLIMGGYLAGRSYAAGRYETNIKGTGRYYLNKILHVILPTFSYIGMCYIFFMPELLPKHIMRFITFTFNGEGGTNATGATWYVFTLFWLYLLTPLAAKLLNKLKNKPVILWVLLFLLWGLGAAYRIMANKYGLDWNLRIYIPFYANLDMYFGGMVFAYLTHTRRFNAMKFLSAIFLVVLIICNCYIYNKASLRGSTFLLTIYQIYYPSLYLPVILLYLCVFDTGEPQKDNKPNLLRGIIAWFIDWLASVSFEFYLFHSLIMDRLAPYILHGEVTTVGQHLLYLFIIAVVTLCFAAPFHNAFGRKKKNSGRNTQTETVVPEK